MIKFALFDLDGTLVNTADDLGRATSFVLRKFGRPADWTREDYISFVGNGARKLLDRAFEHQLSDEELDEALELFKTEYNRILLDNAYVYDGLKDELDIIKSRGTGIAVITNKPHKSAVIMAEALFGKGYFDIIIGAEEDKPKKPDPYSTLKALDYFNAKPEEALFFGDSDVDVYTARNAGIKAVACSWGFRSRESLISASPDVLIDTPKNISKLFEKSVDK